MASARHSFLTPQRWASVGMQGARPRVQDVSLAGANVESLHTCTTCKQSEQFAHAAIARHDKRWQATAPVWPFLLQWPGWRQGIRAEQKSLLVVRTSLASLAEVTAKVFA